MRQRESRPYHLPILRNMETDESDVNLGRMKNTKLTVALAEQELHNRDGGFITTPMSGEEANDATDTSAKIAMSYDAAEFIPPDDPDPERRGLDYFGNVRRGRDSDIVNTTLEIANQYDELQRRAAEISKQQLDQPQGTSNSAGQ